MNIEPQLQKYMLRTAAEDLIQVTVCVWMCVLVSLQDWLFQTQLAAPRHDGHLVLHVETHQVTNAQEHLITGPHLLTQRHTDNGIT